MPDSGYMPLAEQRMQTFIHENRERLLNGELRHQYMAPLPPSQVATAQDDGRWQQMSDPAKRSVRAKMTAWYGAPGVTEYGPGFAEVLKNTLTERDAVLGIPGLPLYFESPSGQKQALDRGVSTQREKPPAGVTNGHVTWFEAGSGLPIDPDFVKTQQDYGSCQTRPARIELVNVNWWDQDLALVRFRYRNGVGEVRWLKPGDPEPQN